MRVQVYTDRKTNEIRQVISDTIPERPLGEVLDYSMRETIKCETVELNELETKLWEMYQDQLCKRIRLERNNDK